MVVVWLGDSTRELRSGWVCRDLVSTCPNVRVTVQSSDGRNDILESLCGMLFSLRKAAKKKSLDANATVSLDGI